MRRLRAVVGSLVLSLWVPLQAQALSVLMEWDPYAQNPAVPAVGFNVYRSTDCTANYQKLTPQPLPVTQTQYSDGTITMGPKYCYYVTAQSALGVESRPSNTVQFQVQEPQAPTLRGRILP